MGGTDSQDRICAPHNDFKGSVTTGTQCKCDGLSVDNKFPSDAAWFFNFKTNSSKEGAFGPPIGVTKPCVAGKDKSGQEYKEEDCPKAKAFDSQPGLFTGKTMPTRVEITAKGCDGWCVSKVCLGSKKWGKRFEWSGMQWMNPCGKEGESAKEEPCPGLPWDYLPLRIKGSTCEGKPANGTACLMNAEGTACKEGQGGTCTFKNGGECPGVGVQKPKHGEEELSQEETDALVRRLL